jgi:phosphoglycolate phosphatase-like HAD superfamily hydrolase
MVNYTNKPLEGILFDLDGTLTDMEIRLVKPFQSSLKRVAGFLPSDEIIGNALQDILIRIGKKSRLRLIYIMWDIARRTGLSRFRSLQFLCFAGLAYNKSKYEFSFLNHAEESISWALENYNKVGIVTSASKKVVQKAIEQLPILGEIPVYITDDEVKHPKPHPEPVELACKQLDILPENTIYIGDLSTDVKCGKDAGSKTMAILGEFGIFTKHLIEKSEPDYIVKNLAEALQVLKGIKMEAV